MLILLALFGCGRSDNGPNREPSTLGLSVPPSAPLELLLEIPAEIRQGVAVPFKLVLENRGDQPADVELGGDPISFDLSVRSSDGSEVWRRLEGVATADILISRTVAPGAAIEFADTWPQRSNKGRAVGPGVYRVRGILPVVGVPGGWGTEIKTLTITP
jgi:hypothetical protein